MATAAQRSIIAVLAMLSLASLVAAAGAGPCEESDANPIVTTCTYTSAMMTEECVAGKYYYDGMCNDAARGAGAGTGTSNADPGNTDPAGPGTTDDATFVATCGETEEDGGPFSDSACDSARVYDDTKSESTSPNDANCCKAQEAEEETSGTPTLSSVAMGSLAADGGSLTATSSVAGQIYYKVYTEPFPR